mmetsp:Transcript_23922/g.57703  ORF Transcript_23922/g.57703 Transcript_23922/m.57703 type:complete len:272 (+) Transcript_23922:59-874(+)
MLRTTFTPFFLSIFSSVHGCPTRCGISVTDKFTRTTDAGGNCKCTGRKCANSSSGTSLSISFGLASKGIDACHNYCCAACQDGDRDYDRRTLEQDDFENTLSVSSEEPQCFCYGDHPTKGCSYGVAADFDECSDQCYSFCDVDWGVGTDGESEDCESFPLYINEYETIDANYISESKASGTPSKVCVCELKGFKIGASNILSFDEQDCDRFCSQEDSFGGVRYWLTTDEEIEITSPPTYSPSASPTSTSSLPTRAVAFFSSVVCVGFLMIT